MLEMSKQSKKKLSEVSMLSLVNWRREIFEIYSDIRRESNGKMAWEKWRVKREELFKNDNINISAQGFFVHVLINQDTNKPISIPVKLKDDLKSYA